MVLQRRYDLINIYFFVSRFSKFDDFLLGIFPAILLRNRTNLVHLVEEKFNNQYYYVLNLLYRSYYTNWKNLDAIHLLDRHNIFARTLNETSIQTFNYTYGVISRDILTRIKPYLS